MTNTLTTLDLCLIIQHQETYNLPVHYLNRNDATALLQKIGANIANYFPQVTQSAMIGVGSLYYIHQMIRPNFPLYTQLFELAKTQLKPKNFEPSIIGIGSEENHITVNAKEEVFSIPLFNKEESAFGEVIHIMPFSLIMPDTQEAQIFFEQLDGEMAQTIEADEVIYKQLQDHFQLSIDHITLATLGDLNGLLAMQLMQIGLEELWTIMQAVIFNLDEMITTLGSGHILYWKLDEVALITPHASIYEDVMSDYNQTLETYQTTTKRLEILFSAHHIPFVTKEIFDTAFFKAPLSIERAKRMLNEHIKPL